MDDSPPAPVDLPDRRLFDRPRFFDRARENPWGIWSVIVTLAIFVLGGMLVYILTKFKQYAKKDEETLIQNQIYLHELGTNQSE